MKTITKVLSSLKENESITINEIDIGRFIMKLKHYYETNDLTFTQTQILETFDKGYYYMGSITPTTFTLVTNGFEFEHSLFKINHSEDFSTITIERRTKQ